MSNSSPDAVPQRLSVLPVEEGSCLLRSYALHEIPRNPEEVVILYYSQDPERGGETDDGGDNGPDQCGEMVIVPESQLYTPAKTDGGETATGTDGKEVPTKINGKYAHTSQKAYSTIWVMDRVGCEKRKAIEFINAVVGASSKAPEVLKANSLDTFGNFITGVSLRASYTPRYLSIFVSIPYLGVGDASLNTESRTLLQYRLRREPTNLPANNTPPAATPAARERIGIFRSKDDYYSNRAPLFPYQKRTAASQALVHMISNLLTSSEQEALMIFRSNVDKLELKLEDDSVGEGQDENFISYGSYIKDVSTMIRIVRSQIGYLEDLKQIFENSYDSKRLTGETRPHRNSYPIPLLRKQPEQLEDVLKSLTAVTAERERFYKELRILVKDLELAKTLCLEGNQVESQKTAQHALNEQGGTFSVLTFVTTAFLPLGFLSSYYAIPEDFRGARFWSVAGPITAAMIVVLALFMWAPDDKIKYKLAVLWVQMFPDQQEPQSGTTQPQEAPRSPDTTKSMEPMSRSPLSLSREKAQDSISEV